MNTDCSSETRVSLQDMIRLKWFLFKIYHNFFFLYFHCFNPHTILLHEDIYVFSKSFLFTSLLLPFCRVCSKKRLISSVYIFEEVLQALRTAAFVNRSYTRKAPIREQICFHIPCLKTLNAEFPVRCNKIFASFKDIAEITKHRCNVWFGKMSLKTGLTSHRERCLRVRHPFERQERLSTRTLLPNPTNPSCHATETKMWSLVLPDRVGLEWQLMKRSLWQKISQKDIFSKELGAICWW